MCAKLRTNMLLLLSRLSGAYSIRGVCCQRSKLLLLLSIHKFNLLTPNKCFTCKSLHSNSQKIGIFFIQVRNIWNQICTCSVDCTVKLCSCFRCKIFLRCCAVTCSIPILVTRSWTCVQRLEERRHIWQKSSREKWQEKEMKHISQKSLDVINHKIK